MSIIPKTALFKLGDQIKQICSNKLLHVTYIMYYVWFPRTYCTYFLYKTLTHNFLIHFYFYFFQIPEYDNFYIDANGIIHNCSHPDDSVHFRMSEEEMFKDIFYYLEVSSIDFCNHNYL